jgi:hypothetical protein
VRKALVEQRLDLDAIDAAIAVGRAQIAEESHARLAQFRGELQASILAQLERSDLRGTADLLPGAIHDAVLHFTYHEVERLRLALDQLTREAIHTCGEQAQRRLAGTLLNLGFRGPEVHLKPTSVSIEAGTLAVGVVGTAIMYFGNIVAGLVVTFAAPLATMFLRERSIRELRDDARKTVPLALAASFSELEATLLAPSTPTSPASRVPRPRPQPTSAPTCRPCSSAPLAIARAARRAPARQSDNLSEKPASAPASPPRQIPARAPSPSSAPSSSASPSSARPPRTHP